MRLRADFVRDWHEHLSVVLGQWGYDPLPANDPRLPIVYFNAEFRRVDARPRRVLFSDVFVCPPLHQRGFEVLAAAFANGGDVTPYLSRRIESLDQTDDMLNDWRVMHFHLGFSRGERFVERTGPLLFAMVADDDVYAINVFEHGQWTNSSVVEILHRNWPAAIARYKISGVVSSTVVTDDDRKALRRNHVNAYTTVSDGTVYAPIGGGTSLAGFGVRVAFRTAQQESLLRKLQAQVEAGIETLRPTLLELGYSGEPELEAHLRIADDQYLVEFEKYGLKVVVHQKTGMRARPAAEEHGG